MEHKRKTTTCEQCGQPQFKFTIRGFDPKLEQVEVSVGSVDALRKLRGELWKMFYGQNAPYSD